uniref:RBBP8 pseudogene 1 n=1 Tax=Callithrix jacchus TaxID=9483 RepID=A0A5F4W8Z6_CALJA
MMQAGNADGGGRRGDEKSSGRESSQFSACDLECDSFKKTWLKLKDLHDKELRRLQAKLASLRKQRLSDGRWKESIAKIKELTEQQRVLQGTINGLKAQLKAKTCDRCSIKETYRLTLEKAYYEMQQRNLFFIAELTKERNKLQKENKMLHKRIKIYQQQLQTSSDYDDLFPGSQMTISDFSVREPAQGSQENMSISSIHQSQSKQMKPTSTKELQQSSEFPIPSFSQDSFKVPGIPFATSTPKDTKRGTEGNAIQKPLASSILTSSLSFQKRYEVQDFFNPCEDKVGQPKGTFQTKVSSQKVTQIAIPWNPFIISSEEYPNRVSETLQEHSEDHYITSFNPSTKEKKIIPSILFPLDSALKSRPRRMDAIPSCNIEFAARDRSNQIPSNEQSALENIKESTHAEYGTNKPQCDTESVFLGCALKRKVKIQSQTEEVASQFPPSSLLRKQQCFTFSTEQSSCQFRLCNW